MTSVARASEALFGLCAAGRIVMERLPHIGHVRIEWRPDRGELLLVDTRVDARRIIGRHPGPELHFDDSGMAYIVDVANCDNSQWASDLFVVDVCRLEDSGGVVVVPNDGDLCLWRDYMAEHKALSIGLKARGAESCELRCFLFARRHSGARLWWSCTGLRSHLSVRGPPNKWYGRHWPAWESHLEKTMGARQPHCRKAKPTSHATCQENVVCTQSFVHERILDEPSLSTWALVGLGVKWAIGGSGSSQELHTESWSHLVCGLLDTWVSSPERRTFACFFGRHDFQVGSPGTGEHLCTFTVVGDVVSWDSSLPLDGKLWAAFSSIFAMYDGQATLMKFTTVLRKAGAALQLLWRQWANHLCMCIEERIVEHTQRRHGGTGAVRGGGRSQLAKLGKFSKMVRLAGAADSRLVLKYFWACRQHFHNQQFVSFALDFSRVSRRSVCVGAISTPDNTIAWSPPQALIQGAGGAHLLVCWSPSLHQ